MKPLRLVFKAAAELGLGQLALYGVYQLGLRSGHYRRLTPPRQSINSLTEPGWELRTDLFPLPDKEKLSKIIATDLLLEEADEILTGKVRLFGGQPVPLILEPPDPLLHWSVISESSQDIKSIWEAGRFGWAIILARAYHMSCRDDYAQTFWNYTQTFLDANPVNQGPHWISAQEVALRLIALVFSIQVFSSSSYSTPLRMALLSRSIAEHAARIPPTLVYARAQNNNHLVSEAAGLYTAAAALPSHPQAGQWKKSGWKWLNHAFQHQITHDGTYIQHSTNYHRLTLQLALWIHALLLNSSSSEAFPPATYERLAAATDWLNQLLDPLSGTVPNLGPNDGAYIFPLSTCPFNDYRPVVCSAGAAFQGQKLVTEGPWEEMAFWYGLNKDPLTLNQTELSTRTINNSPNILRYGDAWAYLRAAQFHSRPGHADQLHLDLWWRGLNIAQDPGTYLYTAPSPWDNALTHTAVHNTLMIDNKEQMVRAGRFLYLDWAQADPPAYEQAEDGSWQRLSAQHNGYRHQGITHQRSLTVNNQKIWLISDIISGPSNNQVHQVRIHWLLPDWEFQIETPSMSWMTELRLKSPHGWISLKINWVDPQTSSSPEAFVWGIARAGQLIAGVGDVHPTWGWTSPTYGYKIPAYACFTTVTARLPIHIQSRWEFA